MCREHGIHSKSVSDELQVKISRIPPLTLAMGCFIFVHSHDIEL
jgi:hypothetical protein